MAVRGEKRGRIETTQHVKRLSLHHHHQGKKGRVEVELKLKQQKKVGGKKKRRMKNSKIFPSCTDRHQTIVGKSASK